MKVYVVYDLSSENVIAVLSDKEVALQIVDNLTEKYIEQYVSKISKPPYKGLGPWYAWDEFELDKQPEVLNAPSV